MKRLKFKALSLLSFLCIASVAFSQNVSEEMTAKLKKLYPATKFTSVKTTPIPGLYEAVMGSNVAYFDATGRYAVFGHVFDMEKQQDLTQAIKAKLGADLNSLPSLDFKSLPLSDAIKIVRGNGKRVVAVFSDPDCPYCRGLESELDKINDVTIYTFMLSLQGGDKGFEKVAAVWCDKEPIQAWQKLMATGKAGTAPADCNTDALKRNFLLAQRHQIRGTPTLINGEGKVLAGAAETAQLELFLGKNEHGEQTTSK